MNPLAKRLTYRMMAVVLVMMSVVAGFTYFSVREYMLDEAEARYTGILLRMHGEFRRRLSDVHVAVKNSVHEIERDIDEPEKMYGHLERLLRLNRNISFSALMFRPDFYPELGRYFVPAARRDSLGGLEVKRAERDWGYDRAVWYRRGIEEDSARWIGSFVDKDSVAESIRRDLQATYATPIHDREGRFAAMLNVELSLKAMQRKMMEDIEGVNEKFEKGRKRKSYCFVMNREGAYVIHPHMNTGVQEFGSSGVQESGSSGVQKSGRSGVREFGSSGVQEMTSKESGRAMIEVDGVPAWIYYKAIKFTDWIIVIVVPKDILFYNGRMLNAIILITLLIGFVVIYLICRRMINETTTPVTAAKAALERELKIAHDIQMAMLPNSRTPELQNSRTPELLNSYDIFASLTPARDVGGDLYDYYLRDHRLFFCIGDVSGKGMPAALMMAVMRAMFRSETRRAEEAAAIVTTMNRSLSEETTSGYFVTMFVGILDLTNGHLDYCNAGSEAPLVIGRSPMALPIKPNLPVGALDDWNYEGQQTQLQPEDMLFLYTDGLSEARNEKGEQFGRQHVCRLANEHSDATPEQLVRLMEEEVHRHAGDAAQSDDITLLTIRWKPLTPHLSIEASMDEIGSLRPYIERVCQQAGLDGKATKRLRLGAEEAVANVINHGHATAVTLSAQRTDTQLLLTIDDDGLPFDPTKGTDTDLTIPADQRPPGGMGLILLHEMTDGLKYQRTDGHNVLTLIKQISPEADASGTNKF